MTFQDSPRSWMVLAGSCLLFFVSSGSMRASGLLFVALVEETGLGRGDASWPFSLTGVVTVISAPLVGFLSVSYSPVCLSFVGSLLMVACHVPCYFSNDILLLSICYGLLRGVSYSLMLINIPSIISESFTKYRSVAMGMTTTGGPLGGVLLPILTQFLLNTYGLRGTFLILGAVSAHAFLGSTTLIFRPGNGKTNFQKGRCYGSVGRVYESEEFIIERERCPEEEHNRSKGKSSLDQEDECGRKTNWERGSTRVGIQNEKDEVNRSAKHAGKEAMNNYSERTVNGNNFGYYNGSTSDDNSYKRKTYSYVIQNENYSTEKKDTEDKLAKCYREGREESTPFWRNQEQQYCHENERTGLLIKTERISKEINCRVGIQSEAHDKTLHTLENHSQKNSFNETHRTWVRWTATKNILTNRGFHLTAFTQVVIALSYSIFAQVIVDVMSDRGFSEQMAVNIITCSSVGEIMGRLALGCIVDKRLIRSQTHFSIFLAVGSTAGLVVAISREFTVLLVASIVLAVAQGTVMSQGFVQMCEYFTYKEVTLAVSFSKTLMGLFFLPVPLVIGFFRDMLGSYDGYFYSVSVCMALLSFAWLMEGILLNRRKEHTTKLLSAKSDLAC